MKVFYKIPRLKAQMQIEIALFKEKKFLHGIRTSILYKNNFIKFL